MTRSDGAGDDTPSRARTLDGATLRRLGAEFVVIVVGVLVALAVDDWRAGVESRRQALRLLSTMEADISASVDDLREAAESAVLRRDALVELLRLAGSPLPPSTEWRPWAEVDLSSVRGAAMRQLEGGRERALRILPMYVQVFDPRTASFDELRSTGGLASIPDPEVQREIVDFFGFVLDFAESNQFLRTDQFALQEAWQGAGIVAGDWIDKETFVRRLASSDAATAAVRRNYVRARDQSTAFPAVADSMETRGARILSRARASLRN